ncbi:putative uncharacterized protein DDB_G0282133 isoform X2 [Metopolophium dirhodum]|uniref:putative uncharacterized protein DDB_G0282133 isoform X2 n=1 Tax=Metopolophium dirhodum TaxID=44670 RepID=UPI00298FB4F4|nr:putative uncharacterized protein DDB_G0282133 isoform X2 [Metopolophium dirhodum]
MFNKMTKKKTSKQLAKISPTKKLYTSSCDKYEKIMTEDKIGVTKSNKDKPSASTFYTNVPEDDKKILKAQGKQIKKKKKQYSKVHNIYNLKTANAAGPSEKRQYSQMNECFVLLSDCNEHKKNHKSHNASTSNNTENSSKNDKDCSSMLNTNEQNIKKKKKEDSKVQNINNLMNDNAVVHTKNRKYSQMNECFVLLSDCNEHKKNHKSHMGSTGNNTKNSSENDKDYSSILKTQGKNIKSKNKIDSKVQKKNNLIHDNAVAHTKKRKYSQMNECFVLLSDCNEHKKNHKSHMGSTGNNTKNSSENDKDYSSILKTQGKNIKSKNKIDSKVQKKNNLINDNAVAHTKKRQYSQINECFVLLSDCNEHKKNHKSHMASTYNNTKNSADNDKNYSSILKTQGKNIKSKNKIDSKVQNINNLINDNAVAHTKKRQYSQLNECFVLLSDCNEHKKNHKSHKASSSNNTENSSKNDKDCSSMLKTNEQNIEKKKKEDSKVQNINNLINDNAVAQTKKRQYSQMNECIVLLSDCNEHKKNHKSQKFSTSNNTENTSENDKDYSLILKTQGKNIKSKNKIDSKVQKMNNLINENAVAHTKKRQYSQLNECFVLLSDCNEHKKNHKSHKASSSNNTENSSKNDKDCSSMLKTNEKNIKKKKKEDSKVQNINNLINDNAVAHTKKRKYSQMKECFVLLSDCNEHKKNHKSHMGSTGNNTKNSSENDKDYSFIFKTRGKKIKIKNKYKIQKINNLENDNAAIHTEKSQLKECFVLLSDFDKKKKYIHKPNKASSRKKTMIGSENSKEYLSIVHDL